MPFLFLAKSQEGKKILKVKDPLKSFKHSVHVFKFSNLAEDHAIQPKIAAHVRILMRLKIKDQLLFVGLFVELLLQFFYRFYISLKTTTKKEGKFSFIWIKMK